MFEAFNRLEPVVKFEAVHIGKAIINDEEMWSQFSDCLERVASVEVMDGAMGSLLVDNLDKENPDILVVFDHENQSGGSVVGRFGRERVIKHDLKVL